MRKIITLFVLASMGLTLVAKPVDIQKAKQVAYNYLASMVKASSDEVQWVYTHHTPDGTKAAFYVFNVGSHAFVLVSADDVAYPVLGYSTVRSFPRENLPSQVRSYYDDLANQVAAAAQTTMAQESTRQTSALWQQLLNLDAPLATQNTTDSVGPLLTTTWSQSPYYNALCPEDMDGQAVTGCVATAMAQIINYWEYPLSGRGTHSYSSNYGNHSVDYSIVEYDYQNMPAELTYASTPAELNAVATLMYHCGVAVNMDYSAAESGAFNEDARAALINFFRYSPNMSYVEKTQFSTDDWCNLLRQHIGADQPVLYSGRGTGGHTFVCDGYKAGDYFHFNFGWGGYADGWYLTSVVNPANMDFTSSQSAIVGIVPDSTARVILGQMVGSSTFVVDEPIDFYHIMGHNTYTGMNYTNNCYSNVYFTSADPTKQLTLDVVSFEDQAITVYDGDFNTYLAYYNGDMDYYQTPIISSSHAFTITYSGNFYYAGFQLSISQDNGCSMVSNVQTAVDTTTVHLAWTETGSATQWQIEYGVEGFAHGNGTIVNATSTYATISNLASFTQYDFYIRSVCSSNVYGPWKKVTVMVEAPYWDDVVTSQPVGYYSPYSYTVEISTPEAFVWWTKNGCSGEAYLTADINLSRYKWRPVILNGNLHGNGHTISYVYINETTSDVGLFSDCTPGIIIEDLGITNVYVHSSSYRVGTMFGTFRGIMRNCYVSNSSVDGRDYTGGLIGENDYGHVTNCYVNANVIGSRWTGLMIGNTWQGIVRNCYAAGTVRHRSYCYIAGLAAYAGAGEITNCYSVETEMGVVGYKGTTIIADTSTFVRTPQGCTLLTPVYFDGQPQTDMLVALNLGVNNLNDSIYNTWTFDTANVNGGYPVFGDKYVIQCPNITDLSLQNIRVGNSNAVVVGWTEQGDAVGGLLRYRRHDMLDSAFTYVTVSGNPDTLYGIPLGFAYDFSLRAICDSNNQSGWSPTVTLIADQPYWTDIVTSQPAGFVVDNDGNVEISSAEGLAWLSVLVNGLYDQQPYSFEGKTVTLTTDIDLAGYRWKPMGGYAYRDYLGYGEWAFFSGTFDGMNHKISNMYINDANSDLGLFGHARAARIKNVIIDGGYVASVYTDARDAHALHSSAIGGLVGYASECYEITNCHSSADVFANGGVGALCGEVSTHDSYGIIGCYTYISSCSASGTVYGRESSGGLIGDVYGRVTVQNCYSTGNVHVSGGNENSWYRGGLIGNFMYATAYNCYAIGTVDIDSVSNGFQGKVIGCPYMNTHAHYIYGQDNVNVGWDLLGNYCEDVADTSQFQHEGDVNALLSPIAIGGSEYYDLTSALNAWVSFQNDPNQRTWVQDSISGYPVFGDFFVPSCYNPTDLSVSNATVVGDTVIRTRFSWSQEGTPDHWEILYVASERSIDSGTVVSVATNPCVLTDIPVGQPLDFYVRAVCDSSNRSQWSLPVTYLADKLHWTEVVTSQPEGYIEDAAGNVFIYSAEGLAWLSSVVNGLNGVNSNPDQFDGNHIYLMADVDLSAYRWTPIGRDWNHSLFNAFFDGRNHTISGLYCNELEDYQGLFGLFQYGTISNLRLYQSIVIGENNTGSIAGYTFYTDIVNCAVLGNVYGIDEVGGVVGRKSSNSIKNSYYIGHAATRNDITRVNTYGGYVGGMVGVPFSDSIINCYVVSEISSDRPYSGIITGTGGAPNYVANCYYKAYDTYLSVTSENCVVANNSSFTGSDTTWTLNTPPFVGGGFITDLLDALNAWVDAHNADGRFRRWATDSAGVNGGYPVFEYITCTPSTGNDSIAVCDSYSWRGMTLYNDTVLIDTVSSFTGCDSIVTHRITVYHPVHTAITESVCDAFNWQGKYYYTSGDYIYPHLDANNCMQVDTLHLTINNPVHTSVTDTACETYTWQGSAYNLSGVYTYSHPDANNCTQVDTLHLVINQPVHAAVTQTACETFTWTAGSGSTYTTTGLYTYSHLDNNSCTQVDTLHLTVNYPIHTAATTTACDSYSWQGSTYSTGGDYTYSHPDANSCIQVDTLHLTINYSTSGDTTAVACDSFTWWNTNYTSSTNTPTHIYNDVHGCDSTVTLHLTVNYSTTGVETATACESYQWHGTTYYASTQLPTFTETNAVGCDSVVTLHLTVNQPVHAAITQTACETYTWTAGNGTTYTTSGLYTYSHLDNNGCTQVDTLHLTVNYPTHTAVTTTACDTYTWQGSTFTTSGNYTYSHPDANSCMQVDTLYLTINYSNSGDTTAFACDSFTWWNTNYTSSTNIPTHVYTNAAGCDSTVTLHLTVNYSTTGVETATACESYQWHGTTYYASTQLPTFTETNAVGCDSVVTLHLTINNPVHTAIIESACDSYTWQGTEYTASGLYTYSHLDDNGCTQVDTLHLTVNHSVAVTVGDTADGSYTWNGTTYTESGTYQWQGFTVDGCDSTVTLILVINPVGIIDIQDSGNAISIYPNPTAGILNIGADGVLSVEVYDQLGRRVALFANTNRIDLGGLSTGNYILKINLQDTQSIRRVILAR